MKRMYLVLMVVICFAGGCGMFTERQADHGGRRLAHAVFFTLHDGGPEAQAALVRECQTYLRGHAGIEYFAAGTMAEALDRPVNVTDFDVSLLIVFADMEAHDAYQTAPRHTEFIERNRQNWKAVRVFDSMVE